MSMDAFAHVCYGVVLEGEPLERFQGAYDEAEAALSREDADWADDLDGDEARDAVVARIPAAVLAAARTAVGAAADAEFIWTGGEDERLGRCATEAGAWVVGYGTSPYLAQVRARWAEAKPEPDLQTWVTGR